MIERRTIPINHEPTRVVVLTREGKALLDGRRDDGATGRTQQYHAGLVKPRELAHDAQLYRLYQAEAGRLEDEGGRITRVVLDYELKREYQTFLNRPDRSTEDDGGEDIQAFATAHQLSVIDGHLELPDLRIEYETADGRLESRDVELVTEHYSRGQLAGKARAGFALYRAAGPDAAGDRRTRAARPSIRIIWSASDDLRRARGRAGALAVDATPDAVSRDGRPPRRLLPASPVHGVCRPAVRQGRARVPRRAGRAPAGQARGYRQDRGFLYHLHARSIYRALQQDDNRNRRRTSAAAIARKLMMLDFVIGEPGVDWYATEADKVAFFTQRWACRCATCRSAPSRPLTSG